MTARGKKERTDRQTGGKRERERKKERKKTKTFSLIQLPFHRHAGALDNSLF